jgi:tRNA(Ile)-lysidine synthase
LIRPLLPFRRQTLLDYLLEKSIPYRLDSSNIDTRFTRNRIRVELLPQLQQHYNPGIVDVLVRLAAQARELHAEVVQQAAQLLADTELSRAGNILVFAMNPLQAAPANRIREMFRLVWERENWPLGGMDFVSWNRLVEIVRKLRSAWDFPGFVQARRVNHVLQLHVKSTDKPI